MAYKGPRLPRTGKYFERSARNDGQRAKAAIHQLHQVIAGNVFYHASATFGHFAVGSNELYANAEIAQAAKAMFQRTSRARRHASAHSRVVKMGNVIRQPL